MYRSLGTILLSGFFTASILCISATGLYAQEQKKPAPARKGLQQRIDFGNAHIMGQSIKSGAVYLMHRKKSDIKNMLEVRQHYREEIKEDFDLKKTAASKSMEDPDKTLK